MLLIDLRHTKKKRCQTKDIEKRKKSIDILYPMWYNVNGEHR